MVTTRSSRPVVMLVEDNQDDIFLAQAAISELPFDLELVIANDAAEALEFLGIAETPGPHKLRSSPHLILMDLKLPKTNGLEILSTLRQAESTRHIPVVMLTTSNEMKDVIHSYQNGANSYLAKPVDFTEFKSILYKTMEYWLTINIKMGD